MAARQEEEEEEIHETQIQDQRHYLKLLSSYLGLSFAVFLGLLPQNAIPLLAKNKALTFRLIQTEEQLEQLRARRKEDSKANARVAEIFASHRHGWQQEEKRLLQQIDESNQEISYLKTRVEEFERLEDELKDLKREVSERDEMINFMSNCSGIEDNGKEEDWYGELGLRYGNVGIPTDHCFVGKPTSFQDHVQFQSHESMYLKHFVARRESSWQGDGISNGVSLKLKMLDHELVNTERFGDSAEVQLQLHKQFKRYQALAAKIDNLCDQMKASDLNEATEFHTQRQTEFLLEAFRLQQRALEINDKLAEVKPAMRRSLDSVRNNFKEIQRSLEIWLARIIGDLEGSLAKDNGASRAMDQYYVPRYP